MEAKRKRHINELTDEFKPFWEPLFSEMGIENPIFFAKLCYNGSEFMSTVGTIPVVRMYAEQISKGQDVYIEFFNWDDLPYNGVRALYKFKNTPDWRNNVDSYVEVTKKSDGTLLPYPSYTFKLSQFELVKAVDITSLTSITPKTKVGTTPSPAPSAKEVDALEEELTSTEKDDNHYAQMTIRDIYAIVQNQPVSNKKWLNKLIEGRK